MLSMKLVGLLILLVLIFPQSAHAYLDPRTGSMILQIVLGGFAGIAIIVRLFWTRIKGKFCGAKRSKGTGDPGDRT